MEKRRMDGVVSLNVVLYGDVFFDKAKNGRRRRKNENRGGGGLIKLHASFPRRGDLFPIDATGFTPPSSL